MHHCERMKTQTHSAAFKRGFYPGRERERPEDGAASGARQTIASEGNAGC